MDKKRLIVVIIASVVVLGLAAAGIVLLAHRANIQVDGNISGTIGVNTVEKPDNLDELEFGITLARIYSNGGGAANVIVKNGKNVTITEETVEGNKAKISILRSTASSDFMPIAGLDDGTVYEEEIPLTLLWDKADILSAADWSDSYLDSYDKVKTEYSVTYRESCLGSYYSSQINVTYWDEKGDPHYLMYSPCISIVLTED